MAEKEKLVTPRKTSGTTNPEKTIYSVKRFMGESYDNIKGELKTVPYKVIKGDNNTARVKIDDRDYTPQELSAVILQKMKKQPKITLAHKLGSCNHCSGLF